MFEYIVDKGICQFLLPVTLFSAIVLLVVTYITWKTIENYSLNAIIEEIKEALFMKWTRNMTIAIVLILLYASNRSEYCQLKRIQGTFEKGLDFAEPACFVNTSNLLMMMNILDNGGSGVYTLLEGPHGSGKTTILQQAAKRISRNIVYVSVKRNNDFGLTLANALSVDMNCEKYHPYIELLFSLLPKNHRYCPGTSVEKLRVWRNLMEKALLQMRSDGKPTPVIIIDHLNRLLNEEGIELLYILQDFAKDMADQRLLTMVFASGERKVYHRLMQNSAKSRMMRFPHAAWEISYEEAIHYLKCLCNTTVPKVDNITISRVINIVGGHFSHILKVQHLIKAMWHGDSDAFLREVKHHLFYLVISELRQLDISVTIPINTTDVMSIATWSLATKLINSETKQISFEEASIIMEPLLEEQKKKLQDANIFYFDLVRNDVSFRWKLVEAYFKEKSG